MKCIFVNAIIVFALFFMQSCIREDVSDCNNSTLQLRFRYTLNNQHSDLFASEVLQVTAYVFDADGKYIGTYSEAGDKLVNNYMMTIPLPEGRYRVAVFCDNANSFSAGWIDERTNSFHNEFQPGLTTVSEFRMMLRNKDGADGYLLPESVPGDLYAGYVGDVLSTYDVSRVTDVNLMKDTKNITVRVSVPDILTRSDAVPEIYVTALNGRYNSENDIDTSHRVLKYIPHSISVTGNTVVSNLRTMRLVSGHAPMLVIKHPSISGYVFNRDITELILSNPKYVSQEDIDREDTFVFEINMSQTDNNIVISILINGWKINSVIAAND